jgi:hypothetical protein
MVNQHSKSNKCKRGIHNHSQSFTIIHKHHCRSKEPTWSINIQTVTSVRGVFTISFTIIHNHSQASLSIKKEPTRSINIQTVVTSVLPFHNKHKHCTYLVPLWHTRDIFATFPMHFRMVAVALDCTAFPNSPTVIFHFFQNGVFFVQVAQSFVDRFWHAILLVQPHFQCRRLDFSPGNQEHEKKGESWS